MHKGGPGMAWYANRYEDEEGKVTIALENENGELVKLEGSEITMLLAKILDADRLVREADERFEDRLDEESDIFRYMVLCFASRAAEMAEINKDLIYDAVQEDAAYMEGGDGDE